MKNKCTKYLSRNATPQCPSIIYVTLVESLRRREKRWRTGSPSSNCEDSSSSSMNCTVTWIGSAKQVRKSTRPATYNYQSSFTKPDWCLLRRKTFVAFVQFFFPPFFLRLVQRWFFFPLSLSFFLPFFSFHFAPSSIRSLCTRIKRSAVVYRGGNTRGRKDHRRGEEAHIRRFVKYSLLKFNISKIRYDFSFDVCRKKKSRGEEEEARQEQKYGHGGRGRRWRPGRRWVVFFPFY